MISKRKKLNGPQEKVEKILKGENISPKVRKFLELSSALTTQIEKIFEKNEKSRKAFGLVFSEKIIKKYGSMHKISTMSC